MVDLSDDHKHGLLDLAKNLDRFLNENVDKKTGFALFLFDLDVDVTDVKFMSNASHDSMISVLWQWLAAQPKQ